MGYDIVAYFRVDQKQIEDFIVENNIDIDNWWNEGKLIVDYYQKDIMAVSPDGTAFDNPDTKDLKMYYIWDEERQLHEIHASYGTNFIRDDRRFPHAFFMRDKPFCLSDINHSLHTAEDAVEIADALEEHFKEEDNLMSFAHWLRTTAKYCDVYELSF